MLLLAIFKGPALVADATLKVLQPPEGLCVADDEDRGAGRVVAGDCSAGPRTEIVSNVPISNLSVKESPLVCERF